MIRTALIGLATAAAVAIMSTMGSYAAKPGVTPNTQAFLKNAAEEQEAQIALGALAAQHAKFGRVKRFGEEMITVHRRVSFELRELAGARDVQLPIEPDDQHKRVLKELAQLKDYAFDDAYLDQILRDHQSDLNEFEKGMHKVDDVEVLRWAHKTLPMLRAHVEEARWLLNSLQTNP